MKSYIKHIKRAFCFFAIFSLTGPFCLNCFAGNNNQSVGQLSDQDSSAFSQNDITGWNPSECTAGGSSGLCGDTATAIYWSALSQFVDDPIKIAGIVGNLANEGGMNPVAWEGSITNPDGSLTYDWDFIYNGGLDGKRGVGAFAITSGLSEYLHSVSDNAPDLLKYFQTPTEYNFNYVHPGSGVDDAHPSYGDVLLEKIGNEEFGKLVQNEVRYAIEDFNPPRTQAYLEQDFASPAEAAVWWMDQWERPAYRNPAERGASAQKAYDEFKDMTCSPSSSSSGVSSGPVSGDDITWIGDSYSVQADNKGLLSDQFPGVDIGPSPNNTSSSYIQGSKFVSHGSASNPSCLSILQDVINAGKLRPYLVFACGTNGGWTDSDISDFQNMIGDKDVQVVVVTSKIPRNDYADSNERLKAMANDNSNIHLADWTSVYDESFFSSDPERIHPTTDPGYEEWTKVISEAISSNQNADLCEPEADTSGLAGYIMDYAWTMDERAEYGIADDGGQRPKPGYKEVYDRRKSEGKFVGSLATYADCGGFVTTIVNESGLDPEYNSGGGNTQGQLNWLQNSPNWEEIGITGSGFDTSQLKQGDVFIRHDSITHTYIYAGEIEGFGSDIASAAYNQWSPQAGRDNATSPGYHVFRKKE